VIRICFPGAPHDGPSPRARPRGGGGRCRRGRHAMPPSRRPGLCGSIRLVDERDDPHRPAARGADPRIDLVDVRECGALTRASPRTARPRRRAGPVPGRGPCTPPFGPPAQLVQDFVPLQSFHVPSNQLSEDSACAAPHICRSRERTAENLKQEAEWRVREHRRKPACRIVQGCVWLRIHSPGFGTARFRQIFPARRLGISACLGTASTAPVEGFVQSEWERPSRLR
jgi:hypothetical protein